MSQKPTPDAIEEAATEVPLEALEPATLRRLAEEFVTRDGTDYGLRERSLEEKVEGLMEALQTGQARIYFEAESETINIVATPDPAVR